MATIHHYARKRYDLGLDLNTIAPKTVALSWCLTQPHLAWSVDRLILSESARDLVIRRVELAGMLVAHDLQACHFTGVKASAGEDEDRLIAQLRSCFRYQDHTKEEFQRAIALLRPIAHTLNWPKIPRAQPLRMWFYNPTDLPVSVSGMISGDAVYELLDE